MTATREQSAVPAVGRPQGSDAILLTVALVAVSTSGPLIAAAAVPAMAIAFWRNAMAAGLLLPVVLATCRDELRSLDRREKRLAALAGLLLALHFASWTPALSYTSVASATALFGDLLAVAGGAFAALYMTAGGEVRRSVSTTTYSATRCSTGRSSTSRRPS